MGAPLPPGIDRPTNAPGMIRARYRCKGCARHETPGQHSKTFPERSKGDGESGVRAAAAWLRAEQATVDAGTYVASNAKITVAEYLETWAAARPRSGRTVPVQMNYLRHVKASGLGARPMRLVRTTEVQAFVTGRSKVLAPQTTRNLYTWVKAGFASAVEDRIIPTTPCTKRIMLPRIEKVEVVPLTVEQVRVLAEAMGERYRIGILLQAALGLRISELLALQVGDVDFLRRTVSIERQLARNGREFAPLKYESRRTVPLSRGLVETLSRHVEKYPPNADGVIVSTARGNPVRSDYYSDNLFKPAVLAAKGIPDDTTSHDLRHHFASVLLAKGVPTNVVAKYLGHTSSRLVETTYGHLMPTAVDVVRAALDDLWAQPAVLSRRSI